MKKVLFATTALVASAGFAAAEVSLSGSAEIGIFDNGTSDAQFFSDLDVTFSLSGETDNGLTFGATIDLDEVGDDDDVAGIPAGDPISATGVGEEHSVFISGGFGTVTMGDTDGAFDWAMTEVNLVGGSIADDETEHTGFDGNAGLDGDNDGQVLRYDYAFGAFEVAASLELDDGGLADDIYGLGFKYSAELGGLDLNLGLGYQDGGASFGDVTGVSVDVDFNNGFVAGINYWDLSAGTATAATDKVDYLGVGVGYTMDALSIGVNYGESELLNGTTVDGFGLAVNYDLGGAVVQFGYGDSSTGTDTYSLGIAMAF